MKHPAFPIFLALLFLVLRYVLHSLRNLIWLINGTHRMMIENRKSENYERSAHVLRIAGRYRYDSVAISARLADFILYHDGFTHPEYVLRDEVTLYHVNQNEAVFVECADGDSPWRLDDYSFSRDGQYRKALRVVVLPIESAYRLAERVGRPAGKLVFIGNIARCGSTLLSQAFEKTDRFTTYTEPSAISDLIDCVNAGDQTVRRHVTATVSLLCKPRIGGRQPEGHVIKVMATVTRVLPIMHALFPEASFVFLYRDHLASMRSLASLIPMLPFAYLQRFLDRWLPALARSHAIYQRFAPSSQSEEAFRLDTKTPKSFVITKILSSTFVYHRCLDSGIQIPAFRYEDLVSRPRQTLTAIFRHCGITEEYVNGAMKAMDVDSQENSMLSKKNTAKRANAFFGEADLQLIRDLCRQNGVPDILENPVLKGTAIIEAN